MEDLNVIYGLYCVCPKCEEDPERVRYVGQTRVGITERFRGHIKPSKLKRPYPVDRWKGEHGLENIRYKVLEVLETPEELDEAEEKWIEELQTFIDLGLGGLNSNKGGKQWGDMSEEAIEKIRQANSRDDVPWAKLNRKKAREIRELYASGVTTSELSGRFGVSRGHVWDVLQNTVWRDPDYTYQKVTPPPITLEDRRSYVLSREDAEDMRQIYHSDNDLTYKDMCEIFDVSNSLVIKVLNNHVYYDPEYTPGKSMGSKQRERISETQRGRKKPEGHGGKVSAAIRGGNHGMSKLGEKDVIEIRRRFKSGDKQKDIAIDYGIKQTQVSRIVTGARWGHIKEGL